MSKESTNKVNRQCACSWSHCQFIYDQFKTNGPDDHPWALEPIRFRQTTSNKRVCLVRDAAFKAGVLKYVPVKPQFKDIVKEEGKGFFIARHHFAIQLWQANKKFTVFMNKHNVSSLDSDPSVLTKGY